MAYTKPVVAPYLKALRRSSVQLFAVYSSVGARFSGGLTSVVLFVLTFVPDIADPFRRSHIVAVCAAISSAYALFGVRGRALLRQRLDRLPPHTAYATQRLPKQVENLDRQVRGFEQRIQAVFKPTPARLLPALPRRLRVRVVCH